jgi:hypothetical protein
MLLHQMQPSPTLSATRTSVVTWPSKPIELEAVETWTRFALAAGPSYHRNDFSAIGAIRTLARPFEGGHMDDAVKEQLVRFVELWNSTEKVTKSAELISTALIRPSINELRYAGRWMVLALGAVLKDEKKIDKLTTVENALSYALLCCMQAKHDAIDSIVLFLHEKIDELNARYSSFVIARYVQDYDHFLREVTQDFH